MSISRDPSDYSPTIHAGQQAKHRDITFSEVADTIEKGEVRNTNKSTVRLFVHEFEHYDRPVGVVADVTNGEVITVEFRH